MSIPDSGQYLTFIGLAFHNHHDAHGHFPSGGWGHRWVGDADRGAGHEQPGGWMYNILPFVEQGTMRMGYETAALLDKLMAGRPEARKPKVRKRARQVQYLIEPDGLVPRQSTDVLAMNDPQVVRAVRFIREHACEEIQLRDVLDQVDVSCSTLAKRFRTALGRTIHAEIQRVRIERAKLLLSTTKLPIKDVSRRAGFAYLQYMTTVFRHSTGHPPAEYRKRMGS